MNCKSVVACLLVISLAGCSNLRGKHRLSAAQLEDTKKIAVVAKINHWMECIYHGLGITIQSVNKIEKDYLLKPDLNEKLSLDIAAVIKDRGVNAVANNDLTLNYLNNEIGARSWSNLTLKKDELTDSGYDVLLVIEGKYTHFSSWGFWKRNGLTTTIKMYIYDIKSEELIGFNKLVEYRPTDKFTCESADLPSNLKIQEIAYNSTLTMQRTLIDKMLPR